MAIVQGTICAYHLQAKVSRTLNDSDQSFFAVVIIEPIDSIVRLMSNVYAL